MSILTFSYRLAEITVVMAINGKSRKKRRTFETKIANEDQQGETHYKKREM